MQRAGSAQSWVISTDIPEPLQFAAFVGKSEHFQPEVALQGVALQWQQWWESLPLAYRQFMDSYIEMAQAANIGQADPTLTRKHFNDFEFHPPNFDNLSSQPALQNLLRHYWPIFKQTSHIEEAPLVTRLEKLGRQINLARLVKDLEQQTGKSAHFQLTIDFTSWPEFYFREISAKHLVLGMGYLEEVRQDEYLKLLKNQITKLLQK